MGFIKNVFMLLLMVLLSVFIGFYGYYLSNYSIYWFFVFLLMCYGVFATTFVFVYAVIAYVHRGEILGDRYTASNELFWGVSVFIVFFAYFVTFHWLASSRIAYLISSEVFSIPIVILSFLSIFLTIYLAFKPRVTNVIKFAIFLFVSIIHFSIILFHMVMVIILMFLVIGLLQYDGILIKELIEILIYSKSVPLMVIFLSIPITALDMYKTMKKRYGIDELVKRSLTLWRSRVYITSILLNRLLVECKISLQDDCIFYDTLIILNQMNVFSIDLERRNKEVQEIYRKLKEKCIYVKLAEIALDIFRYRHRLNLSRDRYKELLKKCRNELMNGRFVNSGELIKMIQEVKSGN